jgi:copper(I)-binding protein
MNLSRTFYRLAAAAALLSAPPAQAAKAPITAQGAWVRSVPPSSRVAAAYLLIKNDSDKTMYLESAETSAAADAEIHRMSETGGMMTMESVSVVPVPAHGQAVLEPGGYHLMLIGLKKPLRLGDKVRLTLRFRGKYKLAVAATVREAAPDAAGIKP